jgi:enoyl-CoA hydratase/carnithine racemase
MSDLRWPFFEDRHRAFAAELEEWALPEPDGDLDARCRALVAALGAGGWLRHCAGAGAMIATAADLRLGSPRAKVAFLFTRVGLAGCDMGACAMLPRIVGQGRAAELLYTGRSLGAEEAERWGFFNRLAEDVEGEAAELAASLASGPTFAHSMTKTMLEQEWDMSVPAAIESEAQAQAICMQTRDFARAYRAFLAKERPVFEGN